MKGYEKTLHDMVKKAGEDSVFDPRSRFYMSYLKSSDAITDSATWSEAYQTCLHTLRQRDGREELKAEKIGATSGLIQRFYREERLEACKGCLDSCLPVSCGIFGALATRPRRQAAANNRGRELNQCLGLLQTELNPGFFRRLVA